MNDLTKKIRFEVLKLNKYKSIVEQDSKKLLWEKNKVLELEKNIEMLKRKVSTNE